MFCAKKLKLLNFSDYSQFYFSNQPIWRKNQDHKKLTSNNNPLKHRLTIQEDIAEAEAMIDKVIAELEK